MVSGSVRADEWRFEITPYLWGATIDGSLATGGGTPIEGPANSETSFFALDNLEGAAFLAFEARRERWRILLDSLYIDFANDVSDGRFLTISARVDGFMVEGAAAYQPAGHPRWEILGGARYFSIRNTLEVQPVGKSAERRDWTDPFVGARYTHEFSDNWRARARADIGGFGINADLMLNLAVEADYRIGSRTALRFGYRYLSADFEQDRFRFDVSFRGPAIGLSIGF
jgi:hypothetical protein